MEFIGLKNKTSKFISQIGFVFTQSFIFVRFIISALFFLFLSVHLPAQVSGGESLASEGESFRDNSSLLEATDSVWLLHNLNMRPEEGFQGEKHTPRGGTAFAIGSNQFITNFHVLQALISGGTTMEGMSLSQDEHEDRLTDLKVHRILAVSAIYDLVLFETKEKVTAHLDFVESFSLKEKAPQLSILGYLEGFAMKKVKQVSKINYTDALFYTFYADEDKLYGMSGGPVLNGDGKVAGVLSGGEDSLVYTIKVENVKKFISGDVGVGCLDLSDIRSCARRGFMTLKERAREGDFLAQYQLGRGDSYIISEELLSTEEPLSGLDWLKKSAEAGFPLAQHELGKVYLSGVGGVTKDFKMAFHWHKKAADQGYIFSQRSLVFMYSEGVGTEKNFEQATYWLKKSADDGDIFFQEILRKGNAR